MRIDADLIREGDANLSRTDEQLVEMTNGCICYLARGSLREVRKLAEEGRFDYLLIESTGISKPLPVAATFHFREEDGASLGDVARLDTMVTVVDAVNLLRDYSSNDFLADRGESLGPEDQRPLVNLLVEQIEFADVVVLNKIDAASMTQIDAVRSIIRSLNPEADIVETAMSAPRLIASSIPSASTMRKRSSIRSGSRSCMASPITSRKPNNMACEASYIASADHSIPSSFTNS